jgi:predicted regulator of Ras-like GTPase activity (Roadblock/LC7/MglB family)
MLSRMDAAQALADLTEISSQVVHVAILGADGAVLATTIPDAGRASRFVEGVDTLLEEADHLRRSRGLPNLSQLEAATHEGSVFVVRRDAGTGARVIAATTRPDPTVGLVFYDLKHCLRSIDEAPAPLRAARNKAGDAA